MTTYQKFKKLNIRHSAIGLEQSDTDVTYYCTPRDAAIIGWAGVDGIHYCTIPEFGEMIFAVSPMNFGDCVHPIAHSFEDLLRLLLSCGSMDALEQCYAWDEEQFKAFLIDCPATEEQQSVLDVLRTEFRLVPLEDAFAYVKKLQAEFDLSQIPYTEEYYDPDTDKILGLNTGADDYITKPFNPVEVTARVRSQLRRYMQLGSRAAAPARYVIGGVELDDSSKEVTLDGEPISLTPIEYDILKLLTESPGKVYSPKEIYRQVWKEAPLGSDNTVAVHIRHLREKIEINPADPRYLKVVWGQGYKMEKGAKR